ncbi:hypothetical protein Efla_000422 [Eimeria flavescens]
MEALAMVGAIPSAFDAASTGQFQPAEPATTASEEEDPVVHEELLLLDFPEFSFAPSLKKRKYVTLPAAGGPSTGAPAAAAAQLSADEATSASAQQTAQATQATDSREISASQLAADKAASNTPDDGATASCAAAAAFLHKKDLQVRIWDLETATPSLLLEDFSFQGEVQTQHLLTTALFRIEKPQHGQQNKAAIKGQAGEPQAHLQGLAKQVISFAVDTTAAAAAAAAQTAPEAAAAQTMQPHQWQQLPFCDCPVVRRSLGLQEVLQRLSRARLFSFLRRPLVA